MAFTDEFCREEETDDNEKQISIDPMSWKQPPPALPPLVKPKFSSASLPCSATSSPEGSFREWSSPVQKPHPAFHPSSARYHSTGQPQHPHHKAGTLLPRSKSCGDGRSSQPSDEFDILSGKHQRHTSQPISEGRSNTQEATRVPALREEEEFKCGAMCLFLPGFVKKKQKQVHLQRQGSRQVIEEEDDDDKSVASRAASLERFECASWSSAAVLEDIEYDGVSAYFDLPLELIRGGNDDTQSPVRTAFVFERERKGVLKKSMSKSGPRKSHEGRHVRFSTSQQASYPTSPNSGCVTPRLFQAREEFNAALLEAQNASINF